MEPGEALGIAAQIAVALAGFAGVVVVFRRESVHEWSALDKLRLRFLLANSILPLCLSMIAVAHHQTHATRNLEMVQRYRVPFFLVVRNCKRKNLSAFGSARGSTRTWQPVHAVLFRSVRDGSHALASVQRCVPGRVLAVFRRNCLPTCPCGGPICPDDPFAAGIER